MIRPRAVALGVLFVSSCALAQVDTKLFGELKWRSIGPYRGGRSLAVAGSDARPEEGYFGAMGGGVWKTTNSGKSWLPVSDGFLRTTSVGALAIAPTNPDVVYAGTGERDIRGDISHGDGMYKTIDGGKTWQHIGLKSSQTISRIVVHPKDANTLWVAAFGHVYGPNPERGIYKSTDGGATWSHVYVGEPTSGCVDICVDPNNPNVLLAAQWEAWRTPFTMNSGGTKSRLLKSTDGGNKWNDISGNSGLPSGLLGKIGVSISPVDGNRMYAVVEAEEGGIFSTDDAGATWTKTNSDRNWRQRAWYYSHIYADTKSKDTVYILNVGAGKSTNGGKTFSGIQSPHSDHHDLWISPTDPKRMMIANDGGGCFSLDGGRTWTEQTYPTGQFYHVTTDNAFPYNILGAQQDNSTVRIASRTRGQGISETDWTDTAGGESGYIAAKPDNPDLVFGGSYGGDLSWFNHKNNTSRSVDPWPDNPMGHGAIDLDHRFQWTYPILFSQHNPNLLFTCSQFVLASNDLGQSWRKLSPDLTRNDPSTMKPSGGPITKDNTSVEYYGTVFTLAESPLKRGVLWAGSDDGLVHVTKDGGGSWTNVTPPDMPKWGLLSMIEASPFHAGTAYAAVDNHENDDYTPYIYVTNDFGATWHKRINGIDKETFVRVVREDRVVKGLLYAGTESGVYISFDNGGVWQPLQNGLPNSPVHDIAWKENDLIVATHGRGFYVLDDLSPLQSIAKNAASETRLYSIRDTYNVRWGGSGGQGVGSNPPSGVIVNYYLAQDVKEAKLEVMDEMGEVFQTLPVTAKGKGFQRMSFFPTYRSFTMPAGMIFWAGRPISLSAPPGKYSVRLTLDGNALTTPFIWKKTPLTTATDKDLKEKFRFQREVSAKIDEAHAAMAKIAEARKNHAKKDDPAFAKSLTEIEEAIYQTKNKSGQDPLNYPIRLNDKLAGVLSNISGGEYRPTKQAYEVYQKLAKLLDNELAKLDALLKTSR